MNNNMLKKLGILFLIKLCLVCVCGSSCPLDWSLSHVMKCLYNVTYGVNGTNVLAGTDTNTIHTFCINGTLNQSVECLDNLYSKCGASDSLIKMAVPSMWRSAVDELCNNLTDHARQSSCIVKLRPTIRSCLEHNDNIFQGSLTKQETWRTLRIKICGYFKGMRLCTAEPVIQNCDADVGHSLGDFLSSISPRICLPGYTYMASETAIGTRATESSFSHIFVLIILTFLARKLDLIIC